jgi:hypothetical protein
MILDYVPTLGIQRGLYRIPRGYERFKAYLRTMCDPSGDDLRLPLTPMNPMGKDHCGALLDEYAALGADPLAAATLAEAAREVHDVEGVYRVTLVLADDAQGGWTNRYASEFSLRFYDRPTRTCQGWLVALLWTGDPASAAAVREAILTVVYRAAYVSEHGHARTLRERMMQEGFVMARAGCTTPVLDEDDLEYTREVIAPFLDAEDMRTTIECLFGDAAGKTLGFSPKGLSPWAGLALALHDARVAGASTIRGSLTPY